MRSASARDERDTAPPAITIEREAYVPVENGVSAVSPCTTEMCAGGMPNISHATCAIEVSMPWPCEWTPIRTSAPPSGVMRTVACSKPGMIGVPQCENCVVPCADCSV